MRPGRLATLVASHSPASLARFVVLLLSSWLVSSVLLWARPVAAEVEAPGWLGNVPPGHVAPLRFGGLFTVDAAAGPADVTDLNAGFDVSDARLSVAGNLEGNFGYFVNTNLIKSTPLLDLQIDWTPPRAGFRAAAGYFRTPFSAEVLIPAPALDFITRSQIVRAVAPIRQVGIQLDQEIVGDRLVARAGVFNGNGLDTNDDQRFLYVLRFDGRIPLGGSSAEDSRGELEYGINGGYSKDRAATLGGGLPDPFEGERWLSGADLRWTGDSVFVSAEGIYASIEQVGLSRRDVFGFQASAGWTVSRLLQLLARYDSLWAGSLASDQDLAIASFVLNFTPIISFQAELRVPVRGEPLRPGGVANLNVTF